MMATEPSHPAAWCHPIPLAAICPDAVACRSQRINPWIDATRSVCTITKTPFKGMIRLRDGTTRSPSLDELRQFGSFPRSFKWVGTRENAWARIGNSVPPMLMRSVAMHMRSLLRGAPVTDDGSAAARLQRIADYPALLEEAWAQAHAPREANAPTVISTFAGCGGSSLGYHMAGFRELLAVEWEQNAADTFRLNFPHVPLYHGDIAKLSVEECLRIAGVAPGELDVFDGSPPCQGFSTAGKREIGDARNQLFREYCRLLRGLRPKAFVMENVSGMVKGDFKIIFAEILRTLKGCGYRVKARLLNAMFFGVPQSRERMIFIGVREDIAREPSHPSGWSAPVTAGAAVAGAPSSRARPMSPRAASIWPTLKPGQDGDVQTPGKDFSIHKASPHRPLPTIRKEQTAGNGQMHWGNQRWLTTGELARCGSFPDGFAWGDPQEAVRRIGNSVPPLLMRSVARHVRHLIA